MDQETFSAVDEFVAATLVPHDEALDGALEAAQAAGLPAIQVSPPQGKLLQLLARLQGARTVLEFGTLGGYSTILLARALPPGGRLITLEANPDYAEVASASIERAGVGEVVEVRVGAALETLPLLERGGRRPLRPRLHRRRQGQHPQLLHLGPRPLPARQPDHRRQRRPRRQPRRSRQRRRRDQGPAPPARDARRRAAGQRHDDPDGGGQGLRRLHDRAGPRPVTAALALPDAQRRPPAIFPGRPTVGR